MDKEEKTLNTNLVYKGRIINLYNGALEKIIKDDKIKQKENMCFCWAMMIYSCREL